MRCERRNRYPGNGPFSDLPPYQRPGFLYGGRGQEFWDTDPNRCARLPWLSRWWWANPETKTHFVTDAVPTSEKDFLESQLSYLKKELDQINKRLEEIGKTDT